MTIQSTSYIYIKDGLPSSFRIPLMSIFGVLPKPQWSPWRPSFLVGDSEKQPGLPIFTDARGPLESGDFCRKQTSTGPQKKRQETAVSTPAFRAPFLPSSMRTSFTLLPVLVANRAPSHVQMYSETIWTSLTMKPMAAPVESRRFVPLGGDQFSREPIILRRKSTIWRKRCLEEAVRKPLCFLNIYIFTRTITSS